MQKPLSLKKKLWCIVFETETYAGRLFDLTLLWAIAASVFVVILDSVSSIHASYGKLLLGLEWFFTILFTAEYLLRLWLSERSIRYARSFYGVVDLLSCLPSYLSLFFIGSTHFAVIRIIRLLRVFRILKMAGYVQGAETILRGLRSSRRKITVFFTAMLVFAVIAGTLIYAVEYKDDASSPIPNIPTGIYYAIVSITTVGYGDITVHTPLGQFLTSLMILAGYAIIAVPTGIIAGDMVRESIHPNSIADSCPRCGQSEHLPNALFCHKCGCKLPPPKIK